jgi:ribosomal protein S18 acetylase RimI-like enzyme
MATHLNVRAASESDLPALVAMDLHYPTTRVLALDRRQNGDEHRFAFRWREATSAPAVYASYSVEQLRGALGRVDAFFIAEAGAACVGLLIIRVPVWTDAGEITDLAIDAAHRRTGAGRALVERAADFARERGLRALWVEPRSDNADAIAFYLKLGFRLSGFNDRMYSNHDDADGHVTLYMYREL